MPRQAREKSGSGYHHAMIRGNEQRKIFLNDNDKEKYLELLSNQVQLNRIEVSAYCLMDNHVHLLVRDKENGLSKSMHSIGTSYVIYFNKKYSRVGHLFQNRFKSETIEDESYLFSALRYIHQNPLQAGICSNVEDYKWSSDLYYRNRNQLSFVNTEILSYISNDKDKAIVEYCRLMKFPEPQKFLEVTEPPVKQQELSRLVKKELTEDIRQNPLEMKHRDELKRFASKMHREYGASMQTIAKELRISKSMVQKLL